MDLNKPYQFSAAALEVLFILYKLSHIISESNQFLVGPVLAKFVASNPKPGIDLDNKFEASRREYEGAIIKYENHPFRHYCIASFCLHKLRTGVCNNNGCKLIHHCVTCGETQCEHFRKTRMAFSQSKQYWDLKKKLDNNRGRGGYRYNRGRGRGNWNNYNNYNNNGYNNNNNFNYNQPSDSYTPPSNNNIRGGRGRGRGNNRNN